MQPKKKSMTDPIIYGLCLVLVLYMALHGAIVYESIQQMVANGELAESKLVITFLDVFSVRVVAEPTNIYFNQYTKQWLLYCAFGWLIVVLAIENSKNAQ